MNLIALATSSLAAPLFFNIAPMSDGAEKTVADDMREYVARTGQRKVLYSLTLHPEGRPAMAKVDRALASYRRLRAELEGSEVELGILLQAILGHWPRTDKEVEPWQRTIDAQGREVRFCALDPDFRAYIREVGSRLAAERPCFILGDDDIRAFSPHAECFCPRHVAEFNRRRGTSYTGEQMRAAVRAAKPGERDFETFMRLQRELVDGVAATLRAGIDAVDPTIPAGSCMPGWCYRFNHTTAQAFAAAGQPALMRLANGNYQERGRGTVDFLRILALTQAYYAYHHDKVPILLSEADTCPHHLWSRSATSWHAHLAMTFFTGLQGAKLWYVNAHKGDVRVSRNYTDMMAVHRRFYPALVQAMKGSRAEGLLVPCLTNFPSWHPVTNPRENFASEVSWGRNVLGRMGIPFTASCDYTREGVWALGGVETVERLSDEDLRQILSHRVLVEGGAARALAARGFTSFLGVSAVTTNALFTGEMEVGTGARCRLFPSDRCPTLTAHPGARVFSHLVYAPYSGAHAQERVAPAATLFENSLGGRVAVSAWHFGVSGDQLVDEARKAWLVRLVDAVAGGAVTPVVENAQDVCLLAAAAADGALLLAVFNLNYDPMTTIDLRTPTVAHAVEILSPDGAWRAASVAADGHHLRIRHALPCYGTAILRVRP